MHFFLSLMREEKKLASKIGDPTLGDGGGGSQ